MPRHPVMAVSAGTRLGRNDLAGRPRFSLDKCYDARHQHTTHPTKDTDRERHGLNGHDVSHMGSRVGIGEVVRVLAEGIVKVTAG